jgi:hypothetical protein
METAKMLSSDECINKMWYLYIMEFYSAIKRNEISSLAGKWMELRENMLCEISQVQKTINIFDSRKYKR